MPSHVFESAPTRYRSLFLSDLHLGSRGCQVEKLLAFLQRHDADNIYLVGDVFDFWRSRAIHWTENHDRVMELLCRRAEQGVNIVRLPGNHDPISPRHDNVERRAARLAVTAGPLIHQAADGRRYLVLHGDCCDFWLGRSHAVSRFGSGVDGYLRQLENRLSRRSTVNAPQTRTPVEALIHQVNAWLRYGGHIEQRLVALTKRRGVDGIICGHLHKPALHERHGIVYANCGDWVDSLTAIAEDVSGTFRLLDWTGRPVAAPLDVEYDPMITLPASSRQ